MCTYACVCACICVSEYVNKQQEFIKKRQVVSVNMLTNKIYLIKKRQVTRSEALLDRQYTASVTASLTPGTRQFARQSHPPVLSPLSPACPATDRRRHSAINPTEVATQTSPGSIARRPVDVMIAKWTNYGEQTHTSTLVGSCLIGPSLTKVSMSRCVRRDTGRPAPVLFPRSFISVAHQHSSTWTTN